MAMEPDYKKLFEATPHPYMVLYPDFEYKIAFVNNKYLEATRTRREEMVGRSLFEVFPDNPDDPRANGVSDLRASLDRVLKERAQDVMGVQKYDIPDGRGGFEVRYWTPVNTPIFGDDGQIVSHHSPRRGCDRIRSRPGAPCRRRKSATSGRSRTAPTACRRM